MEPFPNLAISDNSYMNELNGRFSCIKCKKSRKFFCYTCSLIHPESSDLGVPRVKLPIKIDIIKHKHEIDGKSTSSHAKMLAPEDVEIYEFPNFPDYRLEPPGSIILIFPSTNSISISSLFKGFSKFEFKDNHGLEKGFQIGTLLRKNLSEVISDEEKIKLETGDWTEEEYTLENLPFKKAVFIDSTWNQCRGVFKDPRLNSLKTVIIQNRLTKFWRHQRGEPKWYLATIEAIHQFLIEVHICAWGITEKYYDTSLKDLEYLDTSFIPTSKIVDSTEADDDELEKICKPYRGQYDNILFYFDFMYKFIHQFYDHSNLLSYKR